MIGNDNIQAGIISKLKAASTVTALLATSGEVRELQYQGTDFLYPALRARIGTQTKDRASPFCTFGFVPFTIQTFSEEKSSQEADNIAGVVADFLHGNFIKGTGFILNNIECIGLVGAIQTSEKLWMSESNYLSLMTNH